MTTRDQIRHLLRRFGFGAGPGELAEYEKLGLEGTIDRLINWEKVDEAFPISHWEVCFEPGLPDMYFDAPRIGTWWALRMLMTRRPLQENLTLFWHNHFAVSAQKVEFGPAMAQYVDVMRQHANGAFPDLLRAVSATPAMVKWLDTDTSIKGHPNENFARELLELFTLGIGSYSETDVKEAARAFTGWGLRYLLFEPGAENLQKTARDSVRTGLPMIAFCTTPDLYDSGPKTVLGKTKPYDGNGILDLTATHPETAKRTVTKLWEWYAYAGPEPAVVEKLATKWKSSGGDIKAVLKAMVAMPEFWSPKAIRTKVKSPADFVIGIMRSFELDPILRSLRPATSTPETPLPKPLRDTAGLLWYTMFQQGLALLFPPDVSGWDWGSAWLTTNNVTERMKFAELIFNQGDRALSTYLGTKLATRGPVTAEAVVDLLLDTFDAEMPAEKKAILVKACSERGGPSALADPSKAPALFSNVCKLIFSSPEFQMC